MLLLFALDFHDAHEGGALVLAQFFADVGDGLFELRDHDVFERVDAPLVAFDLVCKHPHRFLHFGKPQELGKERRDHAHRIVRLARDLEVSIREHRRGAARERDPGDIQRYLRREMEDQITLLAVADDGTDRFAVFQGMQSEPDERYIVRFRQNSVLKWVNKTAEQK